MTINLEDRPSVKIMTYSGKVNRNGKVKIKRPVLRHKMYKASKVWMVAGVVGLATAGTMLMTSDQAHAMQNIPATSTGVGTATSATGATLTSSYTQVNVDSSGVTSAANAASQAGVKVMQSAGTTYNVQGSAQLNSATSAVTRDYASQTSALNSAAVEAQNSNANSSAVASLNNQMSAVASSAQAAGLTVNPGSTVTVGSIGMTSAQTQAQIQMTQASASATIASATATINSAKAVTSAVTAATSNAKSEAASATAAGVKVNFSTKAVTSVAEANAIASENSMNVTVTVNKYNQEMAEYNSKIADLKKEQTTNYSGTIKNGGYIALTYNVDFHWHYNVDSDTVTVDSIRINGWSEGTPEKRGSGFWDVFALITGNTTISQLPSVYGRSNDSQAINDTNSFWYQSGGDVAALNNDNGGHLIWQGFVNEGFTNKSIAYLANRNNTDVYVTEFGNISPYTVSRNSDGTFTLAYNMNRSRTENSDLSDDTPSRKQYARWGLWRAGVSVSVPSKPTASTTITIPTYRPEKNAAITLPTYVTGTPETPTATYHINTINYTLEPEELSTPTMPSTPSTPKTTKPVTPAPPATTTPVPVVATAAPTSSPAQQGTLPQTGNANEQSAFLLGVLGFLGGLSLAGLGLKKKRGVK